MYLKTDFRLLLYSVEKNTEKWQRNAKTGNFQPVSAHLFAVRSLAGSDRLQVKLGVSLLQLLYTAVNQTSWNKQSSERDIKLLTSYYMTSFKKIVTISVSQIEHELL